jgi:hypothetical protein
MSSDQQNSKQKKQTVNSSISVDIRKLGPLFPVPNTRMTSVWAVTTLGNTEVFKSTLTLDGESLCMTDPYDGDDMQLTILSRKAYFGGWRKFFRCQSCHRACELIYFLPNDHGCRICLQLTHASVQEAHKHDRFLRHLFPNIPLRLAKRIHRELFKSIINENHPNQL